MAPDPDAHLIALGKRLEKLQKRLAPVRAEHWRLNCEAHEYALSRTGYEPGRDNPPGLFERYAAANEEMGKRNGLCACDEKEQALHRELDPLMREIFRTPAVSVAGLRVKTLAAIEACKNFWDQAPGDLDYDDEAVRSLIEAACAVADIPVPKEAHAGTDDDEDAWCPGSAALN